MFSHVSVLFNEAIEGLNLKSGSVIVDGTLGAGGHAKGILEQLGSAGRLLGFDKDPVAIDKAKELFKEFGDRVMIFHDDFRNIESKLRSLNLEVNGILLDLGVSSPQFDQAERGFSFKTNGPLDMRMNPEETLTAKDVIGNYSKRQLEDIFWQFGEERYSRRIADRIVEERQKRRINTTAELESIIWRAVPDNYRHGRIHPATRVFQALRIEVNKEIESLEIFLSRFMNVLAPDGRVVIISFHSLEDRLVKNCFRDLARQKRGQVLTKKPMTASASEVQRNPRSRSAKMRIFRRF